MENADVIEVLNDLIMINNDRAAGYKQAIEEAKEMDSDLGETFLRLAAESMGHANVLKTTVERFGGVPAEGTKLTGKLYRVWVEIKSMLRSDSRGTVLSNAEAGEDSVTAAYEHALDEQDLPDEVRVLISAQKRSVDSAHDLIKKQRDEQKEVGHHTLTSWK